MTDIPLRIIVTTLNEENRIEGCLHSIGDLAPVYVVDSHSRDNTVNRARNFNASVILFDWNGKYPKKRQWCLDNLDLGDRWVLFVDADERLSGNLKQEIRDIFEHGPGCDGYFIRARYRIKGEVCRFGVENRKLVLFNPAKLAFPEINDLDCPGMGEIEGHYQPVASDQYRPVRLGTLKHHMVHLALEDRSAWQDRHIRYARWAACMDAKDAWPNDPSFIRQTMKNLLNVLPARAVWVFVYSYILKLGFLDGKRGFELAWSRAEYYRLINREKARRKADGH